MGSSQSREYDTTRTAAAKILARDRPVLLAFLSPHCGLCNSLAPDLDQVRSWMMHIALA